MIKTDNSNNCQDIVSDNVNDVSDNSIDLKVKEDLNVENDSKVIKDLNIENDCKVIKDLNVLNDADVLIDETLNGLDQEDPKVIEAVLQRLIGSGQTVCILTVGI